MEQELPIEPGMVVDSAETGLDEQDISQATVKAIEANEQGQVKKVTVEKGVIFKKQIDVPAKRIVAVSPGEADEPGRIVIQTSEAEIDGLQAAGQEALPATPAVQPDPPQGILETTAEEVPTEEGMRAREVRAELHGRSGTASSGSRWRDLWHILGPGFLAGMAGNDASAVTSYAVNGAVNGYGQLWLMLLATPMFQVVQSTCGKIGRVTQHGLAAILREHYGAPVAGAAALVLIVANIGLVAGDLVAIGSGLELITGISWIWFVVPVAIFLWYIVVYRSFAVMKKVFIILSLTFAAYLIAGIFVHPDWGQVLRGAFVPHIGLNFASISSAVALLGATVSPYTMFWQVQAEQEEARPGPLHQQLRVANRDIAMGVLSGNLVAAFIIITTSATLFAHHQQIATAADAARALEPLAGPFAKYLFAIGLIGAGLVAIPILLASTAYALSGTFGWAASLWKKPWQTEGFYLILTVALIVSLIVALLSFDPIQMMFWANVLQGILAPVLVIFVLLVVTNRRIMGQQRIGRMSFVWLLITATVMVAATVLFFWGLITGQ